MGPWVYNPHTGGVKIPPAVRVRTERRIRAYAEAHYGGRFSRLDIHFRGALCYIDAYVESKPSVPPAPVPSAILSQRRRVEHRVLHVRPREVRALPVRQRHLPGHTRRAGEDQFAAALYIAGSQLLVVSARYSAPQLLEPRLAAKEYRDIYIELNGAGTPDSKVFISDLGANGLVDRKTNNMSDSWEQGTKRVTFDGDWDKQKIQEAEYRKSYTAADEDYARILTALVGQAKK